MSEAPDEPNWNLDWIEVYSSTQRRAQVAATLIGMSAMIFKRAYLIQHLDELEIIVEEWRAKRLSPEATKRRYGPFMLERLLDEIKICVFFENFLKAVLINKGFIVHLFKGKAQHLGKLQRKEPITAERIVGDQLTVQELQTQTIGMGMMLDEPAYLKVLEIPVDVLPFLREMNARRNELHLHYSMSREDSQETVAMFKRLNSIVDWWIAYLKKSQ